MLNTSKKVEKVTKKNKFWKVQRNVKENQKILKKSGISRKITKKIKKKLKKWRKCLNVPEYMIKKLHTK